jgi:hypothetical protein
MSLATKKMIENFKIVETITTMTLVLANAVAFAFAVIVIYKIWAQ